MRILSNDYRTSLPGAEMRSQGGPRRFRSDILKHLRANGHEWIGIVGSDGNGEDSVREHRIDDLEKYIEVPASSIAFERIRELSEFVPPAEYAAADLEVMCEAVRKAQPDIVFLNGFSTFCWLIYAAARENSIPVVFQHAGIMRIEIEQYADLYTQAGREMCFEMERDAALGAAVNIFLNDYSRSAFMDVHGLDALPGTEIVPLPHPDWDFLPPKPQPAGEERVLGVVARWDRIKNHSAVLALAEEIRAQGLPWRIRSVTKIPDTAVHADTKARYREIIDVVPPMDREALKEFYASLDAAILPSHFDVSPTVVMEAAARGVPTLIAPRVGWVSEYEACGIGEWIVPFTDPKIVILRLQELMREDSRARIAALAKHIEICHNPPTIYEAYLRIFTAQGAASHHLVTPEIHRP